MKLGPQHQVTTGTGDTAHDATTPRIESRRRRRCRRSLSYLFPIPRATRARTARQGHQGAVAMCSSRSLHSRLPVCNTRAPPAAWRAATTAGWVHNTTFGKAAHGRLTVTTQRALGPHQHTMELSSATPTMPEKLISDASRQSLMTQKNMSLILRLWCEQITDDPLAVTCLA
jgi:hypothetical protein